MGQLVVATREEAETLRERILKGESLFNLAGSYSVDPIGRKLNGDIGWITEGRGMPELLNVLATLQDNQVSEVISTQSGYQLITVLERRVATQKPFEDVRDRVKQMMVGEYLPAYLNELEKRYPVSWNVVAAQAASQPRHAMKRVVAFASGDVDYIARRRRGRNGYSQTCASIHPAGHGRQAA